jgi:hypothetical protein
VDPIGPLTFGLALLGGVLGVVNTWKALDNDRVKLLVRPANATPVGRAEMLYPRVQFCIEVINDSRFPVTVKEVGFLHRGTKARGIVFQPLTNDAAGSTPRRLEAREAVSFFMDWPGRFEGRRIKAAYARTACGRTFKGTSPALRQLNEKEGT